MGEISQINAQEMGIFWLPIIIKLLQNRHLNTLRLLLRVIYVKTKS